MRPSAFAVLFSYRRGSLATLRSFFTFGRFSFLAASVAFCPSSSRQSRGLLFAVLRRRIFRSAFLLHRGSVRLIFRIRIYDRGSLRRRCGLACSFHFRLYGRFGIRELQPAFRAYQSGIVHRGIASRTTQNITPYSLHFHILYQNGQIKKSFWAIVADNCYRMVK